MALQALPSLPATSLLMIDRHVGASWRDGSRVNHMRIGKAEAVRSAHQMIDRVAPFGICRAVTSR